MPFKKIRQKLDKRHFSPPYQPLKNDSSSGEDEPKKSKSRLDYFRLKPINKAKTKPQVQATVPPPKMIFVRSKRRALKRPAPPPPPPARTTANDLVDASTPPSYRHANDYNLIDDSAKNDQWAYYTSSSDSDSSDSIDSDKQYCGFENWNQFD